MLINSEDRGVLEVQRVENMSNLAHLTLFHVTTKIIVLDHVAKK